MSTKKKAPWHSPSECSFDFGYRVGVMHGFTAGLRLAKKKLGYGYGLASSVLQKEIDRAETKRKEWAATRPKGGR